MYSFRNSTTSAGSSFSEIAVKERISEKKIVTCLFSPPNSSSPRAAFSAIFLLINRPNVSLSRSRSASPFAILVKLFVRTPSSSRAFDFSVISKFPCPICSEAAVSRRKGLLIVFEYIQMNKTARNRMDNDNHKFRIKVWVTASNTTDCSTVVRTPMSPIDNFSYAPKYVFPSIVYKTCRLSSLLRRISSTNGLLDILIPALTCWKSP